MITNWYEAKEIIRKYLIDNNHGDLNLGIADEMSEDIVERLGYKKGKGEKHD